MGDNPTYQFAHLGIASPAHLFHRFAAIFGCARWQVFEEAGSAVTAETTACLACSIARKRGEDRPCDLYCIGPLRGLACAFEPSRTLEVTETLWEGTRCRFRLVEDKHP